MHPEVAKLKALQKIDARLEILLKEFERRPQALQVQGGEVGEMQERRAEISAMKKAKKVEIDRVELDVKSFDEKIVESERRKGQSSSDTEFKGLQQQIERFEKEKSEVEEKLLALLDEMDLIRRAEREILSTLGQAEDDLSEDEDEFTAELEEIRAEAGKLVQERETARESIDAEFLDKYDLLFSRYRVTSVVTAEGGVCAGCHMALMPQLLNQLKSARELMICNQCSRILYL